jgi:hypothetical protein
VRRATTAVAWLIAVGALAIPAAHAATPIDQYCAPAHPGPQHRALPLRFGVTSLADGSGIVPLPGTVPQSPAKDAAQLSVLRPEGKAFVVRLNRLFESEGAAGIRAYVQTARLFTSRGFEVELQVRYHPAQQQNGDLAAWVAFVRQVVDAFGPNRSVVAMTITNEVNLVESPNTSDGFYENADAALIQGVIAAKQEAIRRGYRQLRIGFTYAYRGDPFTDQSFWSYIRQHASPSFLSALDFVGTDIYPGNEWPPVVLPPDTFGSEMASALATIRDCYMAQGHIPARTPIWVTENGLPSYPPPYSEAQQASALEQELDAVVNYSGTYNITNYRWFGLRDSETGNADKSYNNGLLRDDYGRKPSFAVYHSLIARYGARAPSRHPHRRKRHRSRRRHPRRHAGARRRS